MHVTDSAPPFHTPICDTWTPVKCVKKHVPDNTFVNVSETRLAPRNLALLLQQARVGAHMSQRDLAKSINKPIKCISEIESGGNLFPPRSLLRSLSNVLGVDLCSET